MAVLIIIFSPQVTDKLLIVSACVCVCHLCGKNKYEASTNFSLSKAERHKHTATVLIIITICLNFQHDFLRAHCNRGTLMSKK